MLQLSNKTLKTWLIMEILLRDLIKVGATRAQPLRQQMDFAENIGHLLTYLPEMLPFLLNSTELFLFSSNKLDLLS